ncbi:conserved hypothetical protein [Leishmania braziliensis MHOM/BR/75/M2904]|uniref:HECT domain-containing protein n=2 Tax=Leishmania braziliensis TaxID=5660 RepID=A4HFA9_LEIBR|nr:conserved hypothetical protein [Leishmania braziliensis MHOM/BR/75/M2904]CAJ2474978.1 unnamed protein product [Leishmania braziliensis]CAJ2475487.1 unnamed protein product [Leishmania braziliensis]CAM39520.1 conserved hypothetical protein [Leishmania braziliensis MHOM/BR/75/M2904]SYZ66925.1 hypothetical_protein [Leishmania braziliensis MHOM/BR/75/M2904]
MAEETCATDSGEKVLQRLAERYYEAYRRGRGGDSAPTVEVSLMHMMAVMGELSALAFTSSSSMSPFEKDEVSALIGKLSISVAMIAEAFHLNVGHSILQYLEEELCTTRLSQCSADKNDCETTATLPGGSAVMAPPPGSPVSAPDARSPQPPPTATKREDSVVLSQRPNDAFFRHIDELAMLPRESFEKAGLRWVVTLPNGAIEELIPNGRWMKVRYEEFPHYLAHIARYREPCRSQRQLLPPSSHSTGVVRRQAYKDRTAAYPTNQAAADSAGTFGIPAILAQAPGYDPDRESTLYSPVHFTGDLFSPMSRAADVQTTSVVPPAAVVAEVGGSAAGFERSTRPSVQHIGRPYDVSSFHDKVNLLRRGAVPSPAIAQLGLTFSVPDGQRVVELVNDGMQVDVTAANVGEFLRLLDNYPRAQAPSGRVHRTNSVRKIDVGRIIPDVPPAFSPSHFSHGLFAPYQASTSSVYVDYDKSEGMLPRYLKEHHVNPTDTRGLYVSAARSSDYATLERIVQEVKVNPSALIKYGVTFSVPSSLEPYSTSEERRSGLHALFPSSALQPVQPEDRFHFLSLARQYYPNVL